jgi:hypothetical protein
VWKRLTIFAVAIAFAPIAVPVNQEPSSRQLTEQSQRPTPPSATVTNDENRTYYQEGNKDKPQGWHKFVTWPEGVTTWAILFTLAAIAGQAVETRRAAQATVRYAEAFIEGQRPIIAAQIVGSATKDLHDRNAPRVRIALSNKGLTTAYEATYQSWIELLPFPFTDFTEGADHFMSENPYSVYPHHDDILLNIPIRKGLSEGQLKDLRDLRLYACVRIRVAFRDAFSPSRYSNFGFYVTHEGAGFLPKYNDSN